MAAAAVEELVALCGAHETPGVLTVSIQYAETHLSELLRFAEDGGYVLVRDGRSPRRAFWLSAVAPAWWGLMDDTPQVEAAVSRRISEMRQRVTAQRRAEQAHG
jgi:hypothetical protein